MSTFNTIARTPLAEQHRIAGATFELINGWETAVRYPQSTSGSGNVIVDISHRAVHEINGKQIDAQLEHLFGQTVELRSIHSTSTHDIYRLTNERAIILGDGSFPDAVDVTGGWTSLALFGPDIKSLFSLVTAIDVRDKTLPIETCCQGPIFGVNTLFGRFASHYQLHVCPDMLEFLWDVLLDAGQEFDLHPAGWEFFQNNNQFLLEQC